jgi:hypothetical protein
MILAPNNRGYSQQRQAIMANATASNDALKQANDQVIKSTQPMQPTALQEGVVAEGARSNAVEAQGRAALGQAAATEAGTRSAAAQAQLKQQQAVNDLGAKLSAAKTTAERQQLQDQILTMLGKERGDRYTVTHAPGGEVTDPNNPLMKTKLADHVVVTDKQTGQSQVIPLGQQQQPAGQTLPEGFQGKDKNGKAFKIVNGQPVAI